MYKRFKCDEDMNSYLKDLSNDTGISMSELVRLAVSIAQHNKEFHEKIGKPQEKRKTYPIDISEHIVEEEIDLGEIIIRIGNSHMMPS